MVVLHKSVYELILRPCVIPVQKEKKTKGYIFNLPDDNVESYYGSNDASLDKIVDSERESHGEDEDLGT